MKTLCRALVALIAFGGVTAANAVPITFEFTGEVTLADPVPNDFGLAVGSTISGSAFIPDADLTGAQTYSPDLGGLDLAFLIGDVSFSSLQDLGFPEFPTLDILDGEFVNLNFFVFDSEFIFSAFAGTWDATQFDPFASLAGTFAVAPAAISEPGTLGLLAIGLLALWLMARRRSWLPARRERSSEPVSA